MRDEYQPPHLDIIQGAEKKQTEKYSTYFEGASLSATQENAKSSSRVDGSAVKSADAVRRLISG